MVLMGIDPALNNVGYALYKLDENYNIEEINYEMYDIKNKLSEENKLCIIYDTTCLLFESKDVKYVSMEDFCFNPTRAKAALKVAEAIGNIKSAIYKKNVIGNYVSPQKVKKLTGNGSADKITLAEFISHELDIKIFELEIEQRIKTSKKQEKIKIKEVYTSSELVKKKKEHITDALAIGYYLIIKLRHSKEEVSTNV